MRYAICLFILIFYNCGEKTPTEEVPVHTHESVLKAYYDAIGGYEAMKSVRTIHRLGHYIEPNYQMVWPAEFKRKRPSWRVIGLGPETPDQIREGYDGSPWEHHKGEEVIRSTNESAKAILVAIDFDPLFVDAKEKGHESYYRGLTEIFGRTYHQIEVSLEIMGDTYTTDFYFDPATGLLTMNRKIMPIHARGEDVEIYSHYSDYRMVEDVLHPHTITERRAEDGKFLNAVVWDSIRVNEPMPDELFSPEVSDG